MFRFVLTIAVFALAGLAHSPVHAQDFSVPDTITIKPTTLAVGESRPIEIWVANDEVVNAIQFTFLLNPTDSGFVRVDSILGIGRLSDPSVLSQKILSPGERDNVPPDTLTVAMFRVAGNPLPPGDGAILAVYVSGLKPGSMLVDTSRDFLRNGTALMGPNNQRMPFEFVSAIVTVSPMTDALSITCPEDIVRGRMGFPIFFSVNASSSLPSPITLSLLSVTDYDLPTRSPSASPLFDGANPGAFEWTPGTVDVGIWSATFVATDTLGRSVESQVRIQVVSDAKYDIRFSVILEGEAPTAIALAHADFDNNGASELLTAGIPSTWAHYGLSIRSLSSAGFEDTIWTGEPGRMNRAPLIGYITSDDNLDFVAGSTVPGELRTFVGKGDGSFVLDSRSVSTSIIKHAAMGDFSADNYLDIVSAAFLAMHVYVGGPDSAFSLLFQYTSPETILSVKAADFNVDGWDDVAVGTRVGLDILLNDRQGGFTKTFHYDQLFGVADIDVTNQGSDFNDDGQFDLCLATPSVGGATSELMVYLGQADGSFIQSLVRTVQGQIFADCIGDFNGDTHLDIAFINGARRYLAILYGNGAGEFNNEARYNIPQYEPFQLDCLDADLDGDLDIVVSAYRYNVDGQLVLFLNELDPPNHMATSLAVIAIGNAQPEVVSSTGAKVNQIMSSIASAACYDKSIDGDSHLDALLSVGTVEPGAYTLRVRPRPDFRQGTPFGLSYKIGSIEYRVATSVPMPDDGYTFTIHPDGASPITPALGEYIQNQIPTFTWPGSGKFEFELAHDAAFGQLIEQNTADGANYTLMVALPQSTTSPYYWRVRPVGDAAWSGFYSFNVSPVPTDVNDPADDLPLDFSLSQNYPNPFNPTTMIGFSLPKLSQVKIEIFNVIGQTVATLADKRMDAGEHSIEWNGRDWSGNQVSSGVYFYRLTSDGFTQSKKMVLLR
jgi:hypothetical protein